MLLFLQFRTQAKLLSGDEAAASDKKNAPLSLSETLHQFHITFIHQMLETVLSLSINVLVEAF